MCTGMRKAHMCIVVRAGMDTNTCVDVCIRRFTGTYAATGMHVYAGMCVGMRVGACNRLVYVGAHMDAYAHMGIGVCGLFLATFSAPFPMLPSDSI